MKYELFYRNCIEYNIRMVEVLGIPLYDQNLSSAVDDLMDIADPRNKAFNYCISATGAHGIIEAHKYQEFKNTLKRFYMNLPDGMPGVWIGRLKGARKMRRCYGPDIFEALLIRTAGTAVKHFFCGGKEGVAAALKDACEINFSNQNVVGFFSPPFREMTEEEMEALGQQIKASGAHIVWIGLSTPKQEVFASRLARFVNVHLIITVGAAFDFHTGRVKQAPKWMQNAGLEWFFRLLTEPRRLYKRYFEIVPMFIYLNIKEFVDFYLFKKR